MSRDRYAQCSDDCTTDCGACKGQGRPPCPQAFHTGLHAGLLVECRFHTRHRGWHRSADGGLAWGGTLTPEEVALAAALRRTA